jgi:hypothetical protein
MVIRGTGTDHNLDAGSQSGSDLIGNTVLGSGSQDLLTAGMSRTIGAAKSA